MTDLVQAPTDAASPEDIRPSQWDAFEFGEPEPVLSRRDLIDMMEIQRNGQWYEPPVPLDGLARSYLSSPHHASAIQLKRNLLVADFIPSPLMSRKTFAAAVLDLLIFGNCYFEERTNARGGLLFLDHALAKYTRRGTSPDQYWDVPLSMPAAAFEPGGIHHLLQPDINQEVYGLPEYLSALQSALLNEAATLFRRRYYKNGSHAGFILYATGDFADGDVDNMRNALKRSKGPGNFRNLFVHSPSGSENGIKIMPIAQLGAADEFLGIKGTTRDDILAAHRVPPQLLGIVPAQGSSGFGNPLQAADMFDAMEIAPLRTIFLDLNDALGRAVIAFKTRTPLSMPAAPAAK